MSIESIEPLLFGGFCFLGGVVAGGAVVAYWLSDRPKSRPPTEPVVRYVHGQAPVVINPPEQPKDEPKPDPKP